MAEQVKVIDRGWEKIKKEASKLLKGKAVSVGWQGTEAGIDHEGMTNVEVASIMEFGTKDGKIPERPMFRSTYEENKQKYDKEIEKIAKGFYKDGTVEGNLLVLGEQFKSDIISKVKSNPFQEWAESTREQKEREGKAGDVVLWDTGQMLNALTAVIVSPGDKK